MHNDLIEQYQEIADAHHELADEAEKNGWYAASAYHEYMELKYLAMIGSITRTRKEANADDN